MKKLIMIVLVIWACFSRADDIIAQVRTSVSAVVSALPEGRRGSPEYMFEFGFPLKRSPAYKELVGIVSNNQDVICANFAGCATNAQARMSLLAAWWGGDEDLYISGLARSLDLAVSGALTRKEFDWYRKGHRNIRRGNLLALRFNEPGMSNLASRVYGYTGEMNSYRRIVSGEACGSISNFLNEISHTR